LLTDVLLDALGSEPDNRIRRSTDAHKELLECGWTTRSRWQRR